MEMKTSTVEDLISRIQRELPDTDRTRYDIAYARGRTQARSAMFFGGLTLGGLLGGALAYLLDPDHGQARREGLRVQATARWNDLSRMAEERGRDVRERVSAMKEEMGQDGRGETDVPDASADRIVVPMPARAAVASDETESLRYGEPEPAGRR
jgi:gas vesicle protein